MTIFGWDASHYDWSRGPMDIRSAVKAGISFMTHKATEGTNYTDPQYDNAAARARDVMPLFGAYHVLHSSSINTQVDYFLRVLQAGSPWWQDGPFLVQLDCERWPSDFPQASAIHAWCDRFASVTGGSHTPVVYASRGMYAGTLTSVSYPLWNAAYPSSSGGSFRSLYPGDGSSNWNPYSGHTPAIWQYTSNATIGSQPQCDANAYRGTLANLISLVYGGNDMADFTNLDPNAWRQARRTEAMTKGLAATVGDATTPSEPVQSMVWLKAIYDWTQSQTPAVLTAEQIAQIAAAVVAAEGNPLTEADLPQIQQVVHAELGKLGLTVAP